MIMEPEKAVEFLQAQTTLRPTMGLILGSAFGDVAEQVKVDASIPFGETPGFNLPSVDGHAGKIIVGCLAGTPVLVLAGRPHYYEGHSMGEVGFPVRVMAAFGIRDLLLTNAAGGIREDLRPGDFMRINDHINLMGINPLRGPARSGIERFVDMTRCYDSDLGGALERAAEEEGIPLQNGVYLAVSGPSYETPAEIGAFARLGADAVGMSTVPEAIVARQCGMRVAGLSCITNAAAGRGGEELSHREVLARSRQLAEKAACLLTRFAKLNVG